MLAEKTEIPPLVQRSMIKEDSNGRDKGRARGQGGADAGVEGGQVAARCAV
jgi:hypothetical protein